MVYHNSGDNGYQGLEPTDERYMGSSYWHEVFPPERRDGLFYRTDLQLDYDQLTAALTTWSDATIQQYQYWVELGWKAEHGTYPAVARFGDKLDEEIDELAEAINELEDPSAVISEAGDVLWCATALACAVTADIDSGLKRQLYAYTMGIQHWKGRRQFPPRWRPTSAALATKYDQLTVGELEELVKAGFEPTFSPAMNILDPEEDDNDASGHLIVLKMLGRNLINGSREQYGRDSSGQPVSWVLESEFRTKAEAAADLVARIYLEVAFIADRSVGASLSTLIRDNVTKITGRIATNTIDKTDGERQG